MPIYDKSTVEDYISSSQICAISLDTSVFDRQQLGLESGLLSRLSQFRGTNISFVLSEIVQNELADHLKAKLEETKAAFEQNLRSTGDNWQYAKEERAELEKKIFALDAAGMAKKRLEDFEILSGFELASVDLVSIREMSKMYFEVRPPFENKKDKKSEFPDAIALLSLEAWCKKNKAKMIVVSKDHGWKKFAETSDSLFYMEELAECMSLFNNNARFMVERFSLAVAENEFPTLIDSIKESVQTKLLEQQIEVQASGSAEIDVSWVETEIKSIVFSNTDMVAIGYNGNVLIVNLEVDINTEITAEMSWSVWDSVDRESIAIGTDMHTQNHTLKASIILELTGDFSKTSLDVDIEEIEVFSLTDSVDFGDISPDWGEDDE